MIIKTIQPVDHLYNAKVKLYEFMRTVTAVIMQLDPGLIQLLISSFIIVIPYVAIEFKNYDLFPQLPTRIFRMCLLTNMSSEFGIDEAIISAIVMVINITIILCSVYHLVFQSFWDPITKLVTFLLKLMQFIAVPVLDFAITKFMTVFVPEKSPGQKIFGFFILVLTVLALLVASLEFFFEIKILRKKTIFWNLKNDISIKTLVFLLFQTCLISSQSVSILIAVVMSLTFCAYALMQPRDIVGETESTILVSCLRFRFLTDTCILVSILLKNPNFAFGLWLAGTVLLFSYHGLLIYVRKHRKLFLPICSSPPEDFYDFYYCCMQQLKGDEGTNRQTMSQNTYIYHLHRFHCDREKCHLNEWLQLSSEKELQSLVSVIIQSKKNQSLHNKLVFQLWNLEMGKRCKVSALFEKTESISEDFVLYCIDKMSKDSEITIQSSESNKNAITKVFYDLIFETSSHYNLFYEELSRSTPIIDSMVRHGTEIQLKIGKLKEVYAELLKIKMINFKMIELYIEFVSKFVSQNALDKDDISRLSKLQQNIYFQDISENYLPTLTFYPQTGTIENANAEAQKFLRSTRFELKCSSVNDISQPVLNLQHIHSLAQRDVISAQEEPAYLFFKRGQKEYGIGFLMVDERLIKGKKLLVMQITEESFSSLKNGYLIDGDFSLIQSLKEFVKVKVGKYRQDPIELNWLQLFEKFIPLNQEKIERSKMIKISTDISDCTLMVKRLNCAVPDHYVLEVHLILQTAVELKNPRKQNSVVSFRRRSVSNNQNSAFQFHYAESQMFRKSTIMGIKGNSAMISEMLRQKTLTAFEKGITAEVVEKVLEEDTDYDRDIKTYRLWQGELYNVDLEDREGYVQTFEGKTTEEHRVQIQNNSSFECYVSVGVVLLALTLIGLSVFVIASFGASTVKINYLSKQHTNIDSLIIDFNRILGLLRDLASNFSASFPDISIALEIQDSYNRIQALKTKPLFDNIEHVLQFNGLKMTGTLIELTDVMFAHINDLLATGKLSMIEPIHTSSGKLVEMMEISQDGMYANIQLLFQTLKFQKNISLYSSLAIIVLLFILLVYFCYRSNSKLKNNLSPLLYLSDGDAHIYQENAAKIKYAVEMIRKNFEIDTQNLLIQGTDGKRRKHPKKVAISTEIIVSVVILACMALGVHLGCLFFFSQSFQGSLESFLQMKVSSKALIQSYSGPAQLATQIVHWGEHQLDQLQLIDEKLHYIMFHMKQFQFSPQLNSYIHTLFFEDSCPVLMPRFNLTQSQCYNTTPQFTIKNPFQLGLVYYFNRQKYYFFNNVTEVFAHTSIHSRPFAEIMTNLTVSFNEESLLTVDSIKKTVEIMSYIIIGIDIAYIVAFFAMQYYFRVQVNSIRVIVDFFREKIVKKKVDDDEDEEEEEKSQEDSSSEDELLGEEKKKQPRDRKRKRTTIESKIPPVEAHVD